MRMMALDMKTLIKSGIHGTPADASERPGGNVT
jgi:hypothetical protein